MGILDSMIGKNAFCHQTPNRKTDYDPFLSALEIYQVTILTRFVGVLFSLLLETLRDYKE